MRIGSFLLSFLLIFAFLPRPALAEEEPSGESPELVPYARDSVGGHVKLGLSGGYAAPFGHIAKSVKSTARSGDGWGLLADLGMGLDRNVVLGAYGEYQRLGSSERCESCSATSWGAGLFVRYHFVQGLRFDPYLSYGLGYRALASTGDQQDADYGGIEWLRLTFGGTWFLLPQLGIGPYFELGGGTMFDLPRGEDVKGAYFRAQLGLRLVVDIPGH